MNSLSELEVLINKLQTGSSFLNKKLNNLIDEIIETRHKIALNVPIYDDTYSKIMVGDYLTVRPIDYSFTFNSVPNILFNNINIECNYSELSDNTVLYKPDLDKYIHKLSEYFVPLNYKNHISCKYDPNAKITFSSKDVPPNIWFKNTFYTKDEDSIFYPLYIERGPDEIKDDSIVTSRDVFYYGAINLLENIVDINISNKVAINKISITESNIDGINSSDIEIILNNVEAQQANQFNSVVTIESLKNSYVNKDLSNLLFLNIETDKTNEESLISIEEVNNAMDELGLSKTLLTPDKDFNVLYIGGGNVPQTTMSEIVYKFNNNDDDLIDHPDNYIQKLTEFGKNVKNEPVALASINMLLALIAHKKSNKTLIVKDSYYEKNIDSIKNELKETSDYSFSVPVMFTESEQYINIADIKNILKV